MDVAASSRGDDLAKSLCRQVQVDLECVKGWRETETAWLGGVFVVRGRFAAREAERVVVPHSALASLSPERMQLWLDAVGGGGAVTVAVVERDGALSYFELAPLSDLPSLNVLPEAYVVEK